MESDELRLNRRFDFMGEEELHVFFSDRKRFPQGYGSKIRELMWSYKNNCEGNPECTITPVCGVTCGENCPAFNLESNRLPCEVMDAAIRAFDAQEDYWKNKIELDRQRE